MTQWGMLLLGVFVAIGVSRTEWNKAGRLAMVMTVIIVALALANDGALR